MTKLNKQGEKRRVSRHEQRARIERKENRRLNSFIAQLGNNNARMAVALAQEWGY